MSTTPRSPFPRLVLAGLALAPLAAQQAELRAPVRLSAGDALLGKSRLFPSPVFHDVDGDGRLDVVVGDLRGHLTWAARLPGDGAPRFGAEQKLKDAEGKILDFGNW